MPGTERPFGDPTGQVRDGGGNGQLQVSPQAARYVGAPLVVSLRTSASERRQSRRCASRRSWPAPAIPQTTPPRASTTEKATASDNASETPMPSLVTRTATVPAAVPRKGSIRPKASAGTSTSAARKGRGTPSAAPVAAAAPN